MVSDKVKKITHLYYSRPEIQKAIFEFSKNREIAPSYMMESFGKRPDSFQYTRDIFEMVKKGATSFHCSEELWADPLNLQTGMNEEQLNELRIGWDLILDIDSKYLDYSKILAEQIMKLLKFHNVKNVGIKFSGSKGFHIIVPWKAFPKEINEMKTSDMFPHWARIILKYISNKTRPLLIEGIAKTFDDEKYGFAKKYITRESGSFNLLKKTDIKVIIEEKGRGMKGRIIEDEFKKMEEFKWSSDFLEKVAPDIALVSSRHLFRMPYSLHEKTSLASAVIDSDKISEFQPKDADPLKVKVKNFLPDSKEGEATELLREALDWSKEINYVEKKKFDFKPIVLKNLSEKNFPPSIQKILKGLLDGRKRALFILINLFRSVGMDKDELEKIIYNWNKKNKIPLKEGYIKSQISWSYRNKIVPPPNFDKDYYKGIGIIPTEEEMRYKNPVSYIVKKSFQSKK